MGRKKKKNQEKNGLKALFDIQEETRYWIFSIFSFALALFLILAAFGNAGVLGGGVFAFTRGFLGIGYYLLPFIFALLGIALIRTVRPNLFWTAAAGSILLFVSGIGLLGVFSPEAGGIVGNFIARPLVSLLDIYATAVILGAVFLAALLMTFDATPPFGWLKGLFAFLRPLKEEDVEVEVVDGSDTQKENKIENRKLEETDGDDEREEEQTKEEQKMPILPFGKRKAASPLKMYTTDDYAPPPLSLFANDRGKPGVGDLKANANIIRRTLQNFGINVEMDQISVGPSVTRYALKPAQGVKLARIVGLQNDLSLALAAHPIRIEAPIPGKSLIGIEIPNTAKTTVGLATLFSEPEFAESGKPLIVSLGRNVTGKPRFGNLSKMPHLLIAGSTGSGKSVAIHTIISSLVRRNGPVNLRFIMIDPKRVELTLYKNIPHLLTPVITDPKKAILSLKWAAKEMDRRYDILEAESVRDIASYHKNIVEPAYAETSKRKQQSENEEEEDVSRPERMPYIIIIIDELADIMSTYPRELEAAIVRLAQMARATGIHLILSTQRPSVDVITGLIKANISSRMAFQVAQQIDSRTIIDMGGAEKLLGAGDMLYVSGEMSKPVRLQSAFIGETEIKNIVKFLTKQGGETAEDLSFSDVAGGAEGEMNIFTALEQDDVDEKKDELYEEARSIVVEADRASTTFLQRKLRIGYARAARLMDMLEERGVVGPPRGAKPREILVGKEEGYGTVDEEYSEGSTDNENREDTEERGI